MKIVLEIRLSKLQNEQEMSLNTPATQKATGNALGTLEALAAPSVKQLTPTYTSSNGFKDRLARFGASIPIFPFWI